jgi:FMN phosphatase YigB (HAD superfamily)
MGSDFLKFDSDSGSDSSTSNSPSSVFSLDSSTWPYSAESSPPSSPSSKFSLKGLPFTREAPSSEQMPALCRRKCDNVIVDFGDVLFSWSAPSAISSSSIPPRTLHKIRRTATWFEYDKGNLDQESCYASLALEFGVEAVGIAETFQRARESLQCNKPMLEFLHAIKRDNRGVKIYAMTNISAPEWELLRRTGPLKQEDWNLFEQIFTSCEAHERKPNLGFYRRVLEVTGVDPIRTLFVDDKLENVLPAQSFGMHGIVYTTFEKVSRKMRNLLREDPIGDGNTWIRTNAKRMPSMTNTGAVLMENFAQLLILELTGERELVDYMAYSRECNFFQGDNSSLLTLVILLIRVLYVKRSC